MAKTYTLNVAGLTRELTICKVNDHMDIAAFIMLGDAELTVAAAQCWLKKCPEFDILLTAGAKGNPSGTRDEPPERQALHLRTQGRKALYGRPCRGGGSVHHHRRQAKLVIDARSWTR